MLKYLPMSTSVRNELPWRFAETEDPEVEAREQQILETLLEAKTQKLIEKGQLKGQLTGMRTALRHVLGCRQLVLSQDDEARIEACSGLATVERWLDQAVTAPTIADALR